MQTISEIINSHKDSIDYFEIELLIANSLGKTREFILMHPEHTVTSHQSSNISKAIKRRIKGEPIAYIAGHKEFYGIDFKVNKHTLVPRPETEMMVEEVLNLLHNTLHNKTTIIDIGTGSGCIINSITNTIEQGTKNEEQSKIKQIKILKQVQNDKIEYFATDISKEALKIARQNAKNHGLDKEIKFLHGSLLEPFTKKYWSLVTGHWSLIITANLPYLSKDIYESAPIDVKKYEPKSALYSAEEGLKHYRILLEQLKKLLATGHWSLVTVFLEISPEQKKPIEKLIKTILPKAEIKISKDLAGKWRLCKINL